MVARLLRFLSFWRTPEANRISAERAEADAKARARHAEARWWLSQPEVRQRRETLLGCKKFRAVVVVPGIPDFSGSDHFSGFVTIDHGRLALAEAAAEKETRLREKKEALIEMLYAADGDLVAVAKSITEKQ